ncbi:MAG: hypothetical protein ACI4QD_05160 [Kiritimatiellia bacterium]
MVALVGRFLLVWPVVADAEGEGLAVADDVILGVGAGPAPEEGGGVFAVGELADFEPAGVHRLVGKSERPAGENAVAEGFGGGFGSGGGLAADEGQSKGGGEAEGELLHIESPEKVGRKRRLHPSGEGSIADFPAKGKF